MYGIYVSTFTIKIKNQLNVGKYTILMGPTWDSFSKCFGFLFYLAFPSHLTHLKGFLSPWQRVCLSGFEKSIYTPDFFHGWNPPKKLRVSYEMLWMGSLQYPKCSM